MFSDCAKAAEQASGRKEAGPASQDHSRICRREESELLSVLGGLGAAHDVPWTVCSPLYPPVPPYRLESQVT